MTLKSSLKHSFMRKFTQRKTWDVQTLQNHQVHKNEGPESWSRLPNEVCAMNYGKKLLSKICLCFSRGTTICLLYLYGFFPSMGFYVWSIIWCKVNRIINVDLKNYVILVALSMWSFYCYGICVVKLITCLKWTQTM